MKAHSLLAAAFALLLANSAAPADIGVIGVVTQASRAHIGNGSASAGSTLYDGDRLSTEAGGQVGIRGSGTLLRLGAETNVTLRRDPTQKRTSVELASGAVVFSTLSASAFEIRADGAIIRAAADQPTVADVRVVSSKSLMVVARLGTLEFSYGGQVEAIPEGASYRVVLDPTEHSAADHGTSQGDQPQLKKPKFLFIAVAAIAVATGIAVHEALESPDKP